MGHELGQTPTFGIATFTAVTGNFFNALFFHFWWPCFEFRSVCGKKTVFASSASLGKLPPSALALSLRLQAIFLMLRVPLSLKCVCSCGVKAFVGSGLLHLVGLVAKGGPGQGFDRTCCDFKHSIYCGFIGFRFCL